MSVQTGIAPQALLALDAEWYDALEKATEERWPVELELQAQLVELASAHLLAFVRAHSDGKRRLPDPVTVPRPGGQARDEGGPERGERLSVAELAALPGLTAKLTETS
jgi:hypothetical protein